MYNNLPLNSRRGFQTMKSRTMSRLLSTILALAMAVSMLTVGGLGAFAETTAEQVIAAIEAIGSDPVSKANFNEMTALINAAQAAYDAWKAENEEAQDTDISNLAKLTAAKEAYKEFVSDFVPLEYKNYTPEQLLALARETSVSGAPAEELAGVTHTGAAGALYTDVTTNYLGKPTYDYQKIKEVATNSEDQDIAYIHENKGDKNSQLRFCDNAAYIIYKFDLAEYTNLAVSMQVCQNYVLEATGDLESGEWIKIADYGDISGGIRVEGNSRTEKPIP